MIKLRPEHSSDQPQIFTLVERAFGKSKEAKLVDLIRERGNAKISIVAFDEASIVGYVLASPISFEPPNTLRCLAIGPVAVAPERQGEAIGSQLMRQAIQTATQQGIDAIFLLGYPAYYTRFGFTRTHIANQYGATEAFMALEIREGCLGKLDALAKNVSEFSEVGA